MKTEVYSWRLSAHRKAELEAQARRKGTSLSNMLHDITSEWLAKQREQVDDEAEQAALRKRVMATVGTVRGGDPTASSRTREIVRERIVTKHLKESSESRRNH